MKRSLCALAALLVLAGCGTLPSQRGRAKVSDCCADFGIDVNQVLGSKAVNCGTINSHPDSNAALARNHKAVACVRRTQSRGGALVVNWGFSIFPDYYLRSVAVFGALGEKILVQIEQQHDGATFFVGPCTELKVLDDGEFEFAGCHTDDALMERVKLRK